MNIFTLVLFIHVLSAIALFIAIAFEGAVVLRLRAAENIEQLRESAGASRRLGAIYGPAVLGILVCGMYLAFQLHIRAAWVPLAFLGTLLMAIVSGIVPGIKMSRLRKALAQSDPSFENLRGVARSNALVVSYGFRAGLAVGILFLMSTTPGLVPSIVVLAVASILGIFFGLGFRRASRSSSAWKSTQPETTRS